MKMLELRYVYNHQTAVWVPTTCAKGVAHPATSRGLIVWFPNVLIVATL